MAVKVTIDLTDVTGFAPALGDSIIFESKAVAGSPSVPGRVITTAPAVVSLRDGKGETMLEPGTVIARIKARNYRGQNQFTLTVPDDEDELSFRELMEGNFTYEPSVIQEAQLYMIRSRQYAEQSEAGANRVGSAERVLQAEQASSDSADDSAASAADSLASAELSTEQADRSEQEADRSKGQADEAETQATSAAASAVASKSSADTSDAHRLAAAQSASEAKADYEATHEDRLATGRARNEAQTARTQAQDYAGASEASALRSEGSAVRAEQTIVDAVDEVTGITDSHRQSAELAAERSKTSSIESKAAEARSRAAAESAEAIATGDLPDATESIRGLVTLTGDLAGSGANPLVPGLSLTAPGAAIQVTPPGEGWGNATANEAETLTGWRFDGEWLSPPHWVKNVTVTVDWCGGSSVLLRGRRPNGTVVTLATIPSGTPESHRNATVSVDLTEHSSLAVGGTWTPEDLDAQCTASLIAQVVPEHSHRIDDVADLANELSKRVNKDDPRLSDTRFPKTHTHVITEIDGLETSLNARPLRTEVMARPAMWMWDGVSEWVAPEFASTEDTVLNLKTREVIDIKEVVI